MDHKDLKCFSEAYQIKALKQTVCEMEDTIMKVTKYCGEIKALEQVIGWVLPMVKQTVYELEEKIMKVTRYCGEIETLTKLIKWAKPMANLDNPEHVQGLAEAEDGLKELIAKRDVLLVQ
mgnify:CR=1 FL=1